MPGRIEPTSITGQVSDLLKNARRHQSSGFDPNEDPVVIGYGASAPGGAGCVAVGHDSYANGSYAVALGYAVADGAYATAVGLANATGSQTTAVGRSASVSAATGTAVGYNAGVSGVGSVAIGANANTSNTDAVALGPSAATTKDNQIMLGTSSSFVEIPGNGTTNGLVLTDTATGTRYLIQITSGALVLHTAP